MFCGSYVAERTKDSTKRHTLREIVEDVWSGGSADGVLGKQAEELKRGGLASCYIVKAASLALAVATFTYFDRIYRIGFLKHVFKGGAVYVYGGFLNNHNYLLPKKIR